jgi:hypothetical protein
MDRAARLGSTVDRGGVDKSVWQRLADAQRAGARACRCSPTAVEEDEAVLEGCSPKHEWR